MARLGATSFPKRLHARSRPTLLRRSRSLTTNIPQYANAVREVDHTRRHPGLNDNLRRVPRRAHLSRLPFIQARKMARQPKNSRRSTA